MDRIGYRQKGDAPQCGHGKDIVKLLVEKDAFFIILGEQVWLVRGIVSPQSLFNQKEGLYSQ